MSGADHAPQDAEDDQAANHVARPDVQPQHFVLGEVRKEERHGQAPVKQPNGKVPYLFSIGDRPVQSMTFTGYRH